MSRSIFGGGHFGWAKAHVLWIIAGLLLAAGCGEPKPGDPDGSIKDCVLDSDCEDGNPCTDDRCLPGGLCSRTPNQAACNDGDPCTQNDFCADGKCQAGTARDTDSDGHVAKECGGDDCSDLAEAIHPGAVEGPAAPRSCTDGFDNDCDSLIDSFDKECADVPDPYKDLDGLEGDALREALLARVDAHRDLGYDGAREFMFSTLDNVDGRVQCVYTGEWVTTRGVPDSKEMDTEHTWARSWGAETSPAKSDLNHLFPTMSPANTQRSNYPFGEVVTATWSGGGSQLGADSESRIVFEPRGSHKGDVARAVFYFAVRYSMNVTDQMEEVLKTWNIEDAPDSKELQRTNAIEKVQGKRNPFVDRPGFVDRIVDF